MTRRLFAPGFLSDEGLTLPRLMLLALQHVFAMYAGDTAVPLIVSNALHLSTEQTVVLINSSLFVAGVATIIQSIGLWKFGARLPVMMGATFLGVSPMIAIASQPGVGLRGYYGALIVAGVLGVLIAPMMGRLLKLFPPVVSGSLITLLGVSLMSVAIGWIGGGQPVLERVVDGVKVMTPNPEYGALTQVGLALFVLCAILLICRFARGVWANLCVMLGIIAGTLLAVPLGQFHSPTMIDHSWISMTLPLRFGTPTFHAGAILSMTVVMIITLVESSAVFLALGEIVGRELSQEQMTNALRADGLGILIGGVFNAFAYTSYSQNVGLVSATGVRSRYVCAAAGCILLGLSALPWLGYLVASIPLPVLGGAGLVMFGMVTVAGIRILAEVDFKRSQTNLFIVAVSLSCGMIPTLAPMLLQRLPEWSAPVTHSSVVLGSLIAVASNLMLNRRNGDPNEA